MRPALPRVAAYAAGVQVETLQQWQKVGLLSAPVGDCYDLNEVLRLARQVQTMGHHRPRDVDGDRTLFTRKAAVAMGVPATENAIRKACRPVACDVHSRAALYDMDEVSARFPSGRVA